MSPEVDGIVESALYVDDVERSVQFYQRIFGFDVLLQDARLAAMGVAGQQVLLLFKKGASAQPSMTDGGVIPPSDGGGSLHVAFSVAKEALTVWHEWLNENGVAIESTVRWKRGGKSIYFRDPDRHLVELVTPGTWSIY